MKPGRVVTLAVVAIVGSGFLAGCANNGSWPMTASTEPTEIGAATCGSASKSFLRMPLDGPLSVEEAVENWMASVQEKIAADVDITGGLVSNQDYLDVAIAVRGGLASAQSEDQPWGADITVPAVNSDSVNLGYVVIARTDTGYAVRDVYVLHEGGVACEGP